MPDIKDDNIKNKPQHKGSENLIPFSKLSPERQREIRQAGQRAGTIKKRLKKTMREQLELIASLPVKSKNIKETLKKLGIEDNEMNNQLAVNYALFARAIKGDVKAYETFRDMIGQRPDYIDNTEPKEAKVILEVVDNSKLEKELYNKE